MELRLAAWSVLPAAVAAGVILALAWRPWRRPAATGRAGVLGAVAFAVGYALGHLQGDLELPFPPREATHRLFWIALGAGAVGALLAALGPGTGGAASGGTGAQRARAPRRLAGTALRLAVAVAVPWWFLATFVGRWETGRSVRTVGGLALGLLVLWSGLDALARRRPGLTWPLVVWGVAAAGSGALLLSGNATYALLAASLAGVLGAAGVVALWHPGTSFAGGAAAVASVVLACLWIGGTWLSELPPASALLLGVAPLAGWAGELPAVRSRGPRVAAAVALVAALAPAGAGLAIAQVNAPEPYDSYDY